MSVTGFNSALRDNTRLAIFVIVITVFALALGDAVIKGISAELTLWQIFTIRSAFVLPVLFALVKLRRGAVSIWPQHIGWTILRSAMLTFMWVAYYIALPHVDLSIASATYYTAPLFITLFSAYFLGDIIGRTGWVAIALGFVGVLLILQPEAERFNWFSALPLLSAVLYALAMILTRSRCRNENVFVLSAWLNLSMLSVGVLVSSLLVLLGSSDEGPARLLFLLGSWMEMGSAEWGVVGLLSIAIIIGSVGAAIAYQIGHSSTIATFDFAYVAFAAIWGYALFQEVPNLKAMTGMILIVCAGILAVRGMAASIAAEQNAAVDAQPTSWSGRN